MTPLPDLTGPIGKLRSACVADERTPGDLRRNAAYWLAVRAGIRSEFSSFRVVRKHPDSSEPSRATAPSLAALGYLFDIGADVHGERARLLRDLDEVLKRSAQTVERTGYADDPLVLAGLVLLAKKLRASEAVENLTKAAEHRSGALPITSALPLVTATGAKPRLAAIDDNNVAHMAAVTLWGLIPEAGGADILPATVLQSAPDRLVVAATLDRLPANADFGNLLVLSALEVLVGSIRQTQKQSKLMPLMNRILFLAANPASPENSHLSLDEEARDIENKLNASRHSDRFTFESKWALRPDDLQDALLRTQPVIVHFSGHGSGTPGIVLHGDRHGAEKFVTGAALKHLFAALKDNIRIVVLNACFSAEQAESIVEVIDFVVGMNASIGDRAARLFAASFYRALGFGRSVRTAFDLGVNALKLEGLTDDESLPELLVRTGVSMDATLVKDEEGDPGNP